MNGYFTKDHKKELFEYEQGVKDGTIHAAWKDDRWDEQHATSTAADEPAPAKPAAKCVSALSLSPPC